MYDDFDVAQYNGNYNQSNWSFWRSHGSGGQFVQKNGQFIINIGENDSVDINLAKYQSYLISEPMFIEARIMLDPAKSTMSVHLEVAGDNDFFSCSIANNKTSGQQTLECGNHYSSRYEKVMNYANIDASWHLFRIEIYPDTQKVEYYVDGERYGPYKLPSAVGPSQNRFRFNLAMWRDSSDTSSPNVYIDYVRMGAIEDEAQYILYDEFSSSQFDGRYDANKWKAGYITSTSKFTQKDGVLVLEEKGPEKAPFINAIRITASYPLPSNKYSYIETKMMIKDIANQGELSIRFSTDKTFFICGLDGIHGGLKKICWREDTGSGENFKSLASYSGNTNKWYIFVIRVDPFERVISFYIDGQNVASYPLADKEKMPDDFGIGCYVAKSNEFQGFMDYVKLYTSDQ
jgi:hypothetical protein